MESCPVRELRPSEGRALSRFFLCSDVGHRQTIINKLRLSRSLAGRGDSMIGRRSIALRRSSLLLTALFMYGDLLPTDGLPAQILDPDRDQVDFTFHTKHRPCMSAVAEALECDETA